MPKILTDSFEVGEHMRRVHGWNWQRCVICQGAGCAECDTEGVVLEYVNRTSCGPTCPLNIKISDQKQ